MSSGFPVNTRPDEGCLGTIRYGVPGIVPGGFFAASGLGATLGVVVVWNDTDVYGATILENLKKKVPGLLR